jgi:hypothetical protein
VSDCREDADTRLRKRLHGIADHSIRVVIDNMVHEAAFDRQMRQPTLTDAERAAIAWCVGMAETTATECDEELAALRGLLDRLE